LTFEITLFHKQKINFFIFLHHFNVLILKKNFKNKKIILINFQKKIKNNHKYSLKYLLNLRKDIHDKLFLEMQTVLTKTG